ncbi:MAG: autotransporter-associated beta strand repeat-containing protein, partial [Verrucomicrobiota bacterium]|nr:autotransporter-associated beta strand repeat-containing protein [Verrucomicrobiota bacterium]
STSSSTWTTLANWNNGLPSTGPQLEIFADSATIQHTIDIVGTTARNTVGIQFDSFPGGSGFTLGSSANNSPGFQSRAGGPANGVLNNDDSTQTFNVAFKMFSSSGIAGAGAGQVFNAAAGDIVFTGNNVTNVAGSSYTIDNNGGTLTNTGPFNITIGIPGAPKGNIVGTGGLNKSGTGTLTLGGNAPNTYSGGTTLEAGTIVAAKAGAFGSGPMTAGGGTIQLGSFAQSLGTLSLTNNPTALDFGTGSASISFANSSALPWGSNLNVTNWTAGVDALRFGTDATGLTPAQLGQIIFVDYANAPGQIDSAGFVSPVPEPSTIALGLLGGAGMLVSFMRRRRS